MSRSTQCETWSGNPRTTQNLEQYLDVCFSTLSPSKIPLDRNRTYTPESPMVKSKKSVTSQLGESVSPYPKSLPPPFGRWWTPTTPCLVKWTPIPTTMVTHTSTTLIPSVKTTLTPPVKTTYLFEEDDLSPSEEDAHFFWMVLHPGVTGVEVVSKGCIEVGLNVLG